MIVGEEDADISSMLRGGVDLDDDGDFDPTNLLSQPINFNESIDELDINIEEEEAGNNSYNEPPPMESGRDSAIPDGERRGASYYDHIDKTSSEVSDPNERYFRTPSPDNRRQHRDRYENERNEDAESPQRHSPQRHSPHDYEPPPYKDRRRHAPPHGSSSPEYPRDRPHRDKRRQGGRNSERMAQVQQRIRQVQQQIHENMDEDRDGRMRRPDNRRHPYRHEPGYPRPEDQEHNNMYPNNYPEEHYYDGHHRRERYPHRDYPRHGRHRSYNGMPSSMCGGGDAYGHPRRRSHQQPLQRPHRGPPMMSHPHGDPRGTETGSGYGPQEGQHHPMHPMPQQDPSLNGRPVHDKNGRRGYRGEPGASRPQHVLGGMSQSLSQQQCPPPPPPGQPMSQSYNGSMNMNASNNNGNIPRRGIQSMSESLNGVANAPRMDPSSNNNGMNASRNGMDRSTNRGIQSMSASLNGIQNMNGSTNGSQNGILNNNNMPRQRGIQSMSASLNGMQQMSQSMNGSVRGGYGGPEAMNQSMNGGNFRHPAMSASQNGMPNMNSSNQGRFPSQRGGHPLQGMSQSLNGATNAPYIGHHPCMDNSNNMGMMNRSNNAMGRSMNGSMNASNNGQMSGVPSAHLLNQVSNLANLPNRGSSTNSSMMQGANADTTKLSRKLMEAMKRTASSRKLIRDLNIAAMLRGDLKSPSSSPSSKNKSVVKAKRKASRQSYTKSQSEAAASREFVKAQKQQDQEEKEQAVPQPQQVAAA